MFSWKSVHVRVSPPADPTLQQNQSGPGSCRLSVTRVINPWAGRVLTTHTRPPVWTACCLLSAGCSSVLSTDWFFPTCTLICCCLLSLFSSLCCIFSVGWTSRLEADGRDRYEQFSAGSLGWRLITSELLSRSCSFLEQLTSEVQSFSKMEMAWIPVGAARSVLPGTE